MRFIRCWYCLTKWTDKRKYPDVCNDWDHKSASYMVHWDRR